MIPNDHKYSGSEVCRCTWCRERILVRHTRVARGASLLDAVAPGWWRKIQVEHLDMSNDQGSHLILQVLGTPEEHNQYAAMRLLLGWNCFENRKMAEHGFVALSVYESHQELTMAWIEVVLRRYVERVEE